MSEKPKPCPFCGKIPRRCQDSGPRGTGWYHIKHHVECWLYDSDNWTVHEEDMAAWNRRTK